MSVWSIALTFFLVANPIGNTPAIMAVVKDFDFDRQKKIMFRESIFSFLIAIFFLFLGEPFLGTLHIEPYSMSFCGGILLLLVSLKMIFPSHPESEESQGVKDPFIVPIATPLITGAGVLSTIMLYSRQEQDNFKIAMAICIAFAGVSLIMMTAPYLQRLLGKKGMLAMEQFMGMILAMISMEMLVKGTSLFLEVL